MAIQSANELIDLMERFAELLKFPKGKKIENLTKEEQALLKQMASYVEVFGGTPDEATLNATKIVIPKPVFAEAMAAFKKNGLKTTTTVLDSNNEYSFFVPKELVNTYKQLVPEAISKECNEQSFEKIKEELNTQGIEYSINERVLTFNKKDKDRVNEIYLNHESLEQKIDEPLAKVVASRMQELGMAVKMSNKENGRVALHYLKEDKEFVDQTIADLQNTRCFKENEFNIKFSGQEFIEFQLKDDVELNKFMDLAVGKKFDYTITKDNAVRVLKAQEKVAVQCKNEMLEELYYPTSINKHALALADVELQKKNTLAITENKGLTRYFVSATHPEYYAVLNGNESFKVYKRIDESVDKSGNYIDVVLAQTHNTKDVAEVGAILNYLGTPIEIPESEFDEKKLGDLEKHPYKEQIDNELSEYISEDIVVPDDEMKVIQNSFKAKVEYYIKHPEEFEQTLEDAQTKNLISEETKEKATLNLAHFIKRNDEINQNAKTGNVIDSLDNKIDELSKVDRQVEKEIFKSKETVYEDNFQKVTEETTKTTKITESQTYSR